VLLKWQKWGFWGFCASAVIALIIDIVLGVNIGMAIAGVFSPLILWAILQITKDGVSCWKQLE